MNSSLESAIKKLLATWKNNSPFAESLKMVYVDWCSKNKKSNNIDKRTNPYRRRLNNNTHLKSYYYLKNKTRHLMSKIVIPVLPSTYIKNKANMALPKYEPKIINGLDQPNDTSKTCDFIEIKACKVNNAKNNETEIMYEAKMFADCLNTNTEDSSNLINYKKLEACSIEDKTLASKNSNEMITLLDPSSSDCENVTNIAISNRFEVLTDTKDDDTSKQKEFTNNKGILNSNNMQETKTCENRRSSRNRVPNRKYNADYVCNERKLDFRLTPKSKKEITSVTNLNSKPTIVLDKIKENEALEKEKIHSLIFENTAYFYKIQIKRRDNYYRHNDYWNLFKHEMFPTPTFYEFHKLCLDHWITNDEQIKKLTKKSQDFDI